MKKDQQAHSRLSKTLQTLAKGASGFSAADVSGYSPGMLWNTLNAMCEAGELHKAKVSHKCVRYFGNKGLADKFMQSQRQSTAKAHASPRARASWPADAVPIITSDTRVTIAPTPPRALYSNTHARY